MQLPERGDLMAGQQSSCSLTTTVVALAQALVESMVHPAVIVRDATDIVASNPQWQQLLGEHASSHRSQTLDGNKTRIGGIHNLIKDLRASSSNDGALQLIVCDGDSGNGREFIARWRRLGLVDESADHLTLVLLEDHEDARQLLDTVQTQRVRINKLLVHNLIVEEKQRRLLGSALHDHVSQLLAHVRRSLAVERLPTETMREAISLIDDAIVAVRDLTFAFSPPILEDLGILPALGWLADDLSRRYQIEASFVDDGTEPMFASDTRTIAFRAVRELANNAVKHAPGAEIVISSLVNHSVCRLTVRDTGPGFDIDWATAHHEGRSSYGLLSIEQQIIALGGSFDLVSVTGEGTRAVITLPLSRQTSKVSYVPERVDHA
jgi:signal transduction histidine kinase